MKLNYHDDLFFACILVVNKMAIINMRMNDES
jgi:hypothetical protein